jgi:hypothetical protein
MKTAIDPLIQQVKEYVGQHPDEVASLGIAGKIKFHASVRTDKLKREAQIVFTLVQGRMAKEVKEHRERKARKKLAEPTELETAPSPASANTA